MHRDAIITNDQREVVEFLSRPSTYASSPDRVETFETHSALVFLAGEEAYKIKKAVSFAYMDYSTLEKRHHFCERETSVNQTIARDLYLGTIPITREKDGGLAIDGAGTPVEWAVHMRCYDQAAMLSSLADQGAITQELIKDLAASVARLHARTPEAIGFDSTGQMRWVVEELGEAFRGAPHLFAPADCCSFLERARDQLRRAEHCLKSRAQRGFVRRCHGDLRLRNIVLYQGKPVPVDALEFDEKLATIDTLYDLAFLIMDLTQRGLRGEANLLLNRYIYEYDSAWNIYGFIAMPLFLACRAGVRAMVNAQRAAQIDGEAAPESKNQEARAYFEAALNYLSQVPPKLIAIGGFSGTGKSTLAADLAPHIGSAPGALHLRSDLERKQIFNVPETERLDPRHYQPVINERIYDYLGQKAQIALKAGRSVVVDAVYPDQTERAAIDAVAKGLNIPFTGLWLTAPKRILLERVSRRQADASDADEDVVINQIGCSTSPISWQPIDASGTAEQTLSNALTFLGLAEPG